MKYYCVLCGEKFLKGTLISYHVFPKSEPVRSHWFKLCDLNEWNITKHSTLCSKHFSQDDFDIDKLNKIRTLKREAIPSIGLTHKKIKRSLDNCSELMKMEDILPSETAFMATNHIKETEACDNFPVGSGDVKNAYISPRYPGDMKVQHFAAPRKAASNFAMMAEKAYYAQRLNKLKILRHCSKKI